MKYLKILILCSCVLAGCTSHKKNAPIVNDEKPEDFVSYVNDGSAAARRVEEYFRSAYGRGNFNGVVLFAKDNNVVYKKAFGFSNIRLKTAMQANTPFQLASVSKQFTALAIMQLKERGKLSYDDSLRKFFPELPYCNITIRHLLTHSSGLPNYMYFADQYWPNRNVALTNKDVIKMMSDNKPARYFRPGSHYSYCNTGYSVLASIVEKISGSTFRNYMEENVFRPAGMRNTFIYNSREELIEKKAAVGYDTRMAPVPFNYQDAVLGDKGVYSTADDMLKYDAALYNGTIVSKKTLDEAFTPAYNKQLRGDRNYGFGWRIEEVDGNDKVVFHGGWWKGFRTYFIRSIDERKTVIVLINSDRHIPFRINELLELFNRIPQPVAKPVRITHSSNKKKAAHVLMKSQRSPKKKSMQLKQLKKKSSQLKQSKKKIVKSHAVKKTVSSKHLHSRKR
jgi:CubicO group peptidase (beta-lactamase class C family)